MPQQPLVPSQTEEPSVSAGPDATAPATPSGAPAAPPLGTPVAPGEVGLLGPYRLVKELGRGGMGAVYAALDTRLDRRLALKVMLPQFAADAAAKERFLREARAAARVKHDNVVTVYEADERAGVPYIAMEFLEGYPLDEYLKRKGLPALPQILRVVAETAAGLAAAHKHGLVHRDVKPANLWLEAPNGRVKVLDFGLAKPVDAETELTQSGAVIGTPAYMSPEQARGERVDHRTDLFSLGAVLYRLCTGKRPFEGPTTMAVLMALGTEEPPAVRDLNPAVPESLAALTHQLLAKSADARPQSADEVVKRLRAIAQELAAPLAQPVEHSTSQPQLVHPQLVVVPIPVTAAPEANPFADIDAGAEATERESAAAPTAPTAARAKSGGKTMWMFAGLAALVAAVAVAGVIIVIKNKDGTETKIEVPDGATVTIKGKDGKTLAQVGPEKAKPATTGDPDRAAAEFALSLGGTVRVNGQDRDLKDAADLPKERFTLTGVGLSGPNVTDAGLAHFKDCKGLTLLGLNGTGVTDAGLSHFKDCKDLKYLGVNKAQVTDAGLVNFKDCKGLKQLCLEYTAVTDAGLAHFQGCKNLTLLWLPGTAVTDAGLAHFTESKNLESLILADTAVTDAGLAHLKDCKLSGLDLNGCTAVTDAGLVHFKDCKGLSALTLSGCTGVTDAGLAQFKDCKGLTVLNLHQTKVTDAGLAQFKDCKGLTHLGLAGTKVTDTGLAHFKDCKELTLLDVRKTPVTAKGLEAFHAAVPGCKIEHDGGVIEAVDVDRKAAEFVLSLGGTVLVNGQGPELKAAAELPKERFTLTKFSLTNTAVTDAGLAHFKDCKGLTSLNLGHTKVTDAGLVHFQDCKGLTGLDLTGTKVTDAGLTIFKDCKGLIYLDLSVVSVTDAGLANFKNCKGLTFLNLQGTKVTDAGLAIFKDCKGLTVLNPSGTAVTDAGLAHFKDCTALTALVLNNTKVTDAGLAQFKDCKGLTFLNLAGTAVTDAGLAHFKESKELTHLHLSGTAVTDSGLKELAGLMNLATLNLTGTKVTDAGVKELQSALPKCKIEK